MFQWTIDAIRTGAAMDLCVPDDEGMILSVKIKF